MTTSPRVGGAAAFRPPLPSLQPGEARKVRAALNEALLASALTWRPNAGVYVGRDPLAVTVQHGDASYRVTVPRWALDARGALAPGPHTLLVCRRMERATHWAELTVHA
jgi:hypothetical protein